MAKPSSKYASFSREQLISRLEKLERERYGLVWEDKEEDVAKQCETELPVLKLKLPSLWFHSPTKARFAICTTLAKQPTNAEGEALNAGNIGK
ncbi:MAG: hypothetical protein FWF67_02595 [Fibromonadales bacterium]|nr:hypothetical protein [Fibromonadales bacterium]